MKIYFRLLSFANPIYKYAIPYIFNTLNLALLAPLLNTLFNQNPGSIVPDRPEHFYEVLKILNYYTAVATKEYGIFTVLQMVCLVIIISVLLGNFFRYLAERTMENLRIHTLLNIRNSVFKNAMNLDLGFFNNERKGDIISKITADVQVVQYSVTGTLQVVFKEPLTLIAYLFMLFVISYKLTLVSMLIIPLAAFIISKVVKKLKEQAIASHQSYATMMIYLDEALNGIKVIKALNAVDFITDRFSKENEHYSHIIKSMARRQQLASPISEFLGILMVAAIVLYGGSLVLSNESDLNAASFIAYIALFSQVMRPAKAMSSAFSNIHSGIAAGERVLNLIDEKPVIKDSNDATDITSFKQEIRLEEVCFAYNENEVLHNISFTIPIGKSVALVGPSGGGKSTLMDLIPRFIQPNSGKITIDGLDIKSYTISSLRSLLGVVNQDSILFNDTIFNNIAFGAVNVKKEDVEEAARIANAHEFIVASPDGYHTNIGDGGIRLSGGQRQRICIARAVLQNPPILLLDEATSALDTVSEKLVQEALNNLMKQRTSLIIAHRLSTIQNADLIIVLENGRIIEKGTHIELISFAGLYSRLIEMQTFIAG
jgi:ATP-binding cassette, subfamily B, bacterial MsbA